MARIRTIKPEFWQNEALANVSLHAKLLAIALLNHADDAGYFMANVALVRAACFPFDDNSKNVLGSIQELSRIGYIEVRECDGKHIGKIVKFRDHQRIDKPQASKIAAIFEAFSDGKCNSKNVPGMIQESYKNVQRLEQGTGNREQGKEQGTDISSEPASQTQEPKPEHCRFPVFPTSGRHKTWVATDEQIQDWAECYPGVDIHAEHRKAHAWIMANLDRRKTFKGMSAFLVGWFSRQQDRSPKSPASPNGSGPRKRMAIIGEDYPG